MSKLSFSLFLFLALACRGMASSALGRDAPWRPTVKREGDRERDRAKVKEGFGKKEEDR